MSECGDVVIYFDTLPNGSLNFVQEEVECPDTHYVVAAFLALFSCAAILLNVLLIVTVAASYTLKKKAINMFALSLAVGHVLEGVLSVPLSAAFAARQRWPLGVYECRVDAAVSEATLLLTSLSVLLLCLDRALMMKYLHNYRKYMTPTKRTAAVVATWTASLLLTSPLLCGYLESYPHEARLGCSAVDAAKDVVYASLMLALGYLLPLCGMLACIAHVARIVRRERKQLKKLQLKRSFAYTEQVFVTPHLRTEQGPTLMVLAVLLLYALLVLPQAITIHVDQIVNSYNMTGVEELEAEEMRLRLENATMMMNGTAEGNSTVAPPTPPPLVRALPMVRNSAVHEPIFMWFRYGFLILYPIAALAFHKDLRKKAEGLLFCCRPNTVDDYSSVRPISAYVKKSDSAKKSGRSRSQNHVTSYKTPVLFSTANGLHLRVMNSTHRSNMRFLGLDLSLKGSFAPDPEFEIFLNDLTVPSEDLPDADGLQERTPEHDDFQDTIELAEGGGGSPNSADSGVVVEPARPRSNKPKKTVRFAARSTDMARHPSDSDEQALLPNESPVELKPTRSRTSTPSPGARKIKERSRLRQKAQPAPSAKPSAKPAQRGQSLERTFSVSEGAQRRRSLPPAAGRAAPRPTNKYRAPSRQTSTQPHPPPRQPSRARGRRRSSTDIELVTFTADDSFGVVR